MNKFTGCKWYIFVCTKNKFLDQICCAVLLQQHKVGLTAELEQIRCMNCLCGKERGEFMAEPSQFCLVFYISPTLM